MKIDMKNEREKSYKNGWFGTTLKEKKINKLSDICDWIEDMCELAEKGSKRQIWGTKKKDDRGMLGILNVCQKNDAFNKIKDLPHGIFDCVNLKKLLDEITKCVKNTYVGRTKSSGFSKSLKHCNDYISKEETNILTAGDAMQLVIYYLNVPHQASGVKQPMFELGNFFVKVLTKKEKSDNKLYESLATETNEWLQKIIKAKKIMYKKTSDNYAQRVNKAEEALEKVIKTEDSWIDQKSLGQELANNLKKDLNIFNNLLKNNEIEFKDIKKN